MKKHSRILINISILFFAIYLLIIYTTYSENKASLLTNTKNNQLKLVHAYKEKFDEKLLALKRIVESIGQNIITKDRDKEFNTIKDSLTAAMQSGSGFTSVYIAYPDNFTISGRPDWYYTPDYIATQRPWYLEAIQNGKTTITKSYKGSPGFGDTFYISIVSPIFKKGELLAVMSSDLEIESVQNELAALFPLEEGFAFLMTKEGDVLAHTNKLGIDFNTDKNRELLKKISKNKTNEQTVSINNRSYIFTYEPLENSDWLVISVLDEEGMYKQLDHQLWMNLLSSSLLFLLGFGGIIIFSLTQKKLYDQHTLLGLFAKSPTWAVMLTDKQGNVLFVNKSFEYIFELKSKSIYGLFLDDVLPHLSIQYEKCKQISCFDTINNNPHEVISYIIEKSEKIYRVQITPLLKYKKEFEGAIVTVNDITHEKELEKKESEHEQILIQNSKMAALGEMISAISHQWRQPLSTLLMLISNAEENVEKEQPSKALEQLNRSRHTIALMNETVNAFRNFYKEDFGKDTFDIINVIKEVILISTPQMQMNGIELSFTCKEKKVFTCKGHPSYLKQVLINLLSNAKDELSLMLKEEPLYDARIKINLEKVKDGFAIYVEDNGRGISEVNALQIFKPFFTTKGERGTGMGLHLCKLLVEAKMNGKLILQNAKEPTLFLILIGDNHA